MLIDSPVPDSASTADRTRIAMLTLRLRSLQDELAALGGASADWNPELAHAQLKLRLDSLLAERRRVIEESLEQVKAEAAASINAAHVEAARIVAGLALEQLAPTAVVDPVVPAALTAPTLDIAGLQAGTIKVNFDTEALAAAIAAVLDARPSLGTQQVPVAPQVVKPVAKKTVAASMVQPDVVLALISLLIVLSILFAWAS